MFIVARLPIFGDDEVTGSLNFGRTQFRIPPPAGGGGGGGGARGGVGGGRRLHFWFNDRELSLLTQVGRSVATPGTYALSTIDTAVTVNHGLHDT